MAAVKEARVPLLGAGSRVGVQLRLRVLPRSCVAPPPLLDLRNADLADPTTAPVQLLEGQEYSYEWQSLDVPDEGVVTDPEEMFSPTEDSGIRGRLRTGLMTGSLRVVLRSGQDIVGSLELEVRSRKLNYLSEYRWMLRDIAAQMSELIMQRFAASMAHFSIDSTRDAVTLYQRFEFLKAVLCDERLELALQHVTQHPHVAWTENEETVLPGRSIRASSELARSMSKAGRRREWDEGPVASIPSELTQTRTEPTRNTTPNRFVRFALERWRHVIADIDRVLSNEGDSRALARGRWEVAEVLEKLNAVLSHEMFNGVEQLNHFPADNPVIHRRTGYRDIYKAYLEFELAAHLCWQDRQKFSAGQRDVAQLYEYWVFFQLAQLIAELTGASFDLSNLLSVTSNGLNIGLKSGRQTVISGVLERGSRKLLVSFSYNRTFKPTSSADESWTLSLRPDYTLSIAEVGNDTAQLEPVLVHFDAKYKLEKIEELFESDESGTTEKVLRARAKQSDLVKMHAYRDAIRHSAGAYVVYPGVDGDAQQSQQFNQYKEVLPGLGAFVLRPSEEGKAAGRLALRTFIGQVFDHVAARLSRHERARSWTREAYTQCDFGGGRPAFAFGEPAANATLLLGYVKSIEHWRWIKERMTYNLRTEDRPGGVAANSELLFSQLLLLYSRDLDVVAAARIIGGPELLCREEMIASGYPEPKGNYLCVQLSSLELPQHLARVRAAELEDFVAAQDVRHGEPIAVRWAKLRRALKAT